MAWEPLPEEVDAGLASWAAGREISGTEVLKERRVLRLGPAVLKLFTRRGWLGSLLRVDPAWREARLAFAIRPVRAPRPWAALCGPRGSVLVSEFVSGTPLHRAWDEIDAAHDALPIFLARLHGARILHGDPHHENMIWDGEQWTLLDLGSLRRGAHRLLFRSLVTRQWARLVHDLSCFHADAAERLASQYALYRRTVDADGGWAPGWEEVLRVSRTLGSS